MNKFDRKLELTVWNLLSRTLEKQSDEINKNLKQSETSLTDKMRENTGERENYFFGLRVRDKDEEFLYG